MKFVAITLAVSLLAMAAVAQDQAMATKPSADKMINVPGLPKCITGQPMRGDPGKGAFVIYAKASAGCDIPMHWHTAGEELSWISGSGHLKMKDEADQTMTAGMFAHFPAKHPHALKCTTACTFYVNSDGAFDIHYVDASGNEIPTDQALSMGKMEKKSGMMKKK